MALWVLAGGWAFARLPPDGSAGLLLAGLWATLLVLRWLPWARWGWPVPRVAGLCCPAPQPRASDVGMGWMMGTLWWHAEGCLPGGVPAVSWVLLHAVSMAALAAVSARWLSPAWRQRLAPLALGLAGLLALLVRGDALWLLMLLLTLAWACEPASSGPLRPALARALMLLAGPLGLYVIHLQWPLLGPQAFVLPVAALGLAVIGFRVLSSPWHATRFFPSGGSA